jgi:hypothetical protein
LVVLERLPLVFYSLLADKPALPGEADKKDRLKEHLDRADQEGFARSPEAARSWAGAL